MAEIRDVDEMYEVLEKHIGDNGGFEEFFKTRRPLSDLPPELQECIEKFLHKLLLSP